MISLQQSSNPKGLLTASNPKVLLTASNPKGLLTASKPKGLLTDSSCESGIIQWPLDLDDHCEGVVLIIGKPIITLKHVSLAAPGDAVFCGRQ